jgi:hypothetical protein
MSARIENDIVRSERCRKNARALAGMGASGVEKQEDDDQNAHKKRVPRGIHVSPPLLPRFARVCPPIGGPTTG